MVLLVLKWVPISSVSMERFFVLFGLGLFGFFSGAWEDFKNLRLTDHLGKNFGFNPVGGEKFMKKLGMLLIVISLTLALAPMAMARHAGRKTVKVIEDPNEEEGIRYNDDGSLEVDDDFLVNEETNIIIILSEGEKGIFLYESGGWMKIMEEDDVDWFESKWNGKNDYGLLIALLNKNNIYEEYPNMLLPPHTR